MYLFYNININIDKTKEKKRAHERSSTYITVIYYTNGIITVNYRIFKEGRKLVYS